MFPLFISLWALWVASKVPFESLCPLSQGKHRNRTKTFAAARGKKELGLERGLRVRL